MWRTRGAVATVSTLALAAGVAGCTDQWDRGTSARPAGGQVSGPDDRLTVLSAGPVQAWDPQRITDRRTAGFASRTWMRTLTAYQPAADLDGQGTLTGDLAEGTGESNGDATRWTFSLRRDATWEDGSRITCEDVQHGVARSFDEDVTSSGYALAHLDIPRRADGTSRYPGPSGTKGETAESRRLLEQGVECTDDSTVVFHLAEPVGDFDEVVSLPEFAPYKQAKGGGDRGTHRAFSSGPYQLEDGWTESTGGTWVRNEEWDPASDPLRRPGPTSILHKEGVDPGDALSEIIEGDDGGRTLALDPLPAALLPALDEAGEAAQSVDTDGQFVDYLAVSSESSALRSTTVRNALAVATDRRAYAEATGSGTPTWSLLGDALPSSHEGALEHGPTGNPDAAKKLLEDADVDAPVELTLAHRAGQPLGDALEGLLPGWEKAGFDVTLEPIDDEDYFTAMSSRTTAEEHDLVWANWGPDHPSASTVLPALFDDRANLTKDSVGRNYGLFEDDDTTEAMDEAAAIRDGDERARAWSRIDAGLLRDGAYVPLRQSRLTYAAGSEVTSLVGNPVYGGVPEIGRIGVAE